MDRSNRNTALASAMTEELARCGVALAVICPGSRSTPLALALLRQPEIATVSIVDERSGAFFALGAANATRRPVAIVCTSGTAAANLHPALCEADEAAVPLIALTCDRPPELRGIGAGQTIDQIALYGTAVRWFCEVGTHDADDAGLLHMRATACRAFASAAGDPRPGPVHLNVSWRDPLGPEPREGDVTATSPAALFGRGDDLPLTEVYSPALAPRDDDVAAIATDIREAERGIIVAGRQPDPALGPALAELSAVTGYPLLAEPTSQARATGDRGCQIWAYDAIARLRPRALEPELVLRFGDLPTSKALREWLASLDGCAQLVVDPQGGWNDATRKAGMLVRADPVGLAHRLTGMLPGEAAIAHDWGGTWERAGEAAAREIAAELDGLDELTEPGVHAALSAIYAEGELVYTASSMPVRDQEAFLTPVPASPLFLANRGANGIDGTVSSAIGAATASGRPAWVVLGDLALHHDSNGLAALRHCPTPVRIVVLNNDGGGIFEFLPQAGQVARDEFEAIFGTPLGLDLTALAGVHGVEYRRISRLAELGELPRNRHLLLEVRVDRQANVAVHRALWESARQAVEIALEAPAD